MPPITWGDWEPDTSSSNNIEIQGDTFTLATAIPDSVVTRPDDNDSFTGPVGKQGVETTTTASWPSIQGRISSNVVGVTRAYLEDMTDSTVIADVDISSLSAGDVFTFSDVDIPSGDYAIYLDAEGSDWTNGWYDSPTFPYDSADGQISITGRYRGEGSLIPTVSEVGNINL